MCEANGRWGRVVRWYLQLGGGALGVGVGVGGVARRRPAARVPDGRACARQAYHYYSYVLHLKTHPVDTGVENEM